MNTVRFARRSLQVGVLLTIGSAAGAQTIVESATGSSSVILQSGGVAFVNFADEAVKFGHTSIVSSRALNWGFDAKLKAPNGFANLSQPSAVQGEGRLFIRHSWDYPNRPTNSVAMLTIQWLTLQLSGSQGTFPIAASTTVDPVQRVDKRSYGFAAKLYHNAMWNIGGETFLTGIAGGVARTNNYADLPKVTVCQQTAVAGPGASVTTIQQCKDARLGSLEDRTRAHGATDVLWYPRILKYLIALDAMGRYDGAREHAGSLGAGLFFAKPSAPAIVLGGPTIEWREGSKPLIGVQVGIPF
jgi:hypothetical protein